VVAGVPDVVTRVRGSSLWAGHLPRLRGPLVKRDNRLVGSVGVWSLGPHRSIRDQLYPAQQDQRRYL